MKKLIYIIIGLDWTCCVFCVRGEDDKKCLTLTMQNCIIKDKEMKCFRGENPELLEF